MWSQTKEETLHEQRALLAQSTTLNAATRVVFHCHLRFVVDEAGLPPAHVVEPASNYDALIAWFFWGNQLAVTMTMTHSDEVTNECLGHDPSQKRIC